MASKARSKISGWNRELLCVNPAIPHIKAPDAVSVGEFYRKKQAMA
jgi:hypothetical protein